MPHNAGLYLKSLGGSCDPINLYRDKTILLQRQAKVHYVMSMAAWERYVFTARVLMCLRDVFLCASVLPFQPVFTVIII